MSDAAAQTWAETRGLVSRAGLLVLARIAGSGLTLLYTLALARIMSPAELGTAMAAMAAAFLLSVAASLNIEAGAIRYLVRYAQSADDARAAGFVALGRRIVFAGSALAVPAGLWGLWSGAGWTPVALAVLIAPVLALTRVQAKEAGALDAVLRGALPRILVRPVLFLAAILTAVAAGWTLSALHVMALYLVAALTVAALQWALLRRVLAPLTRAAPCTDQARDWLVTGAMLAPVLVMTEYRGSVMLAAAALGLMAAEVAQMAIAAALLNALVFALAALDMSFAPRISASLNRGERARTEALIRQVTVLKCAVAGLGGIAFWQAAPIILSLIGAHYAASASAFAILVAIPLATAAFGPAALVMTVTGARRALLTGAASGLVLTALAVPLGGWSGGLLGACIGAAAAHVAMQAVHWARCRRATGIDTSVLACLRRAP